MTDALEEVAYHYLCTYQWEHRDDDPAGVGGYAGQFLSCPEDGDDVFGKQFANQGGKAGDAGRYTNGIAQHTPDAVVLVRSPVVSRNGLHTLYQTYHGGDKQHDNAVDDTVGANGHVTSVIPQPVVDEQHHDAGAGVHQEGTQTYNQTLADNVEVGLVDTSAQVQQFGGPAEQFQLYAKRYGLTDDGGPGSSGYSPMEDKDEQGVQKRIDDDGQERTAHGNGGMPGTAHNGIQSEVQMRDDIAQQDDEHILAGIG